ncbi:MAG: efflux RND transporter permease subunit [Caulobacteraceae bacterium]|nr:efflux RND transporter permease subunit [Caulobacter sp.]
MNPSAIFIRRPVATILLTIGVCLMGIASYFVLAVASLPSTDRPTISVQARLPGASPEVMATTVATPLERRLGQIADVTDLTSSSSRERTEINVEFGADRDINGAARDVQAAINASQSDLPSTLRSPPTYNKINPANAPIMILNLTSDTLSLPQVYDQASLVLQQKLSQIQGVGEADVQGASSPAVRVELNPTALTHYGIGLEDVRAAIAGANARQPLGSINAGARQLQVYTNDRADKAQQYRDLVIAYRNTSAVRLADVADVQDGAENVRNLGLFNGKPSIVVRIQAAPGANVVATVDRIKAVLPALRASLPPTIQLNVSLDRTTSIRASLADVERTLLLSVILVVLVVLVFLRNGRATLVPGVAVVTSLLGTLAVMYALHFSLDNLSLMALTVATGFVVDDAIVVLENITRHVEAGMPRFQAALQGAKEVGFTVISMSISLIAVFIPILMMAGIVGQLFREFAITLAAAILISLLVSLTTTPMMAAYLVDEPRGPGTAAGAHEKAAPRRGLWRRGWSAVSRRIEGVFTWALETYEGSLAWALDHGRIVLALLAATIALNVYLYTVIPKGFFPQQDTGVLLGFVQVDQASSFARTKKKFVQLVDIVRHDPAIETVTAFSGQSGAFMFIALKPEAQRPGVKADDVIARVRRKTYAVNGAQLFLQSSQDIRVGGRSSNAQYQYTLQSDNADTLKEWSNKLLVELQKRPQLTDVNTDQMENGLETFVTVDRPTAAKLGITASQVDTNLYDAFGQRQASTIYNPLNQYYVIMEVAPNFQPGPEALSDFYVQPANNAPWSAAAAVVGSAASAQRLSSATVTANAAVRQGATRPTDLLAVVGGAAANSDTGTIASPAGPATPTTGGTAGGGSGAGSTSASVGLTGVGGGQTSAGGLGQASGGGGPSSALAGAGASRTTTGGGASNVAQTGSAISTTPSRMVPLTAFSTYALSSTPTSVNHQDGAVATTLSFNLPPGQSLSDAQRVIADAVQTIHMPDTVRGSFKGTAQLFADTLKTQPLLILAALVAVYLVLGVLYESYIHPLTVLSTLPSAGIGALLALMLLHMEFDIIGLIGIVLLIGIVKKNAIMIIDFALTAERDQGLSSHDAIYQASLLRFRPILMTTMAAILGALPLAIGLGEGSELRRPLGVAIVGGLIASQVLTLITTPVVYLFLDKLRKPRERHRRRFGRGGQAPSPDPTLVPPSAPRGGPGSRAGAPAPQGA